MSNTIWDKPTTKKGHDDNRKLSEAGTLDLERRPTCANCGDILSPWIPGSEWDGHPVLYIGREQKVPYYAIAFHFCDGECLTEWCADNNGQLLADSVADYLADYLTDLMEDV